MITLLDLHTNSSTKITQLLSIELSKKYGYASYEYGRIYTPIKSSTDLIKNAVIQAIKTKFDFGNKEWTSMVCETLDVNELEWD